ncbi:TonB-dependent receptor [Acidobacteria bacterium AH-259-G07]|nr:TonB-dependent receptor [Acidobacteria bacterium AH-259-G07]
MVLKKQLFPCLLLLLVMGITGTSLGQTATGSVRGIITDATGGVIPGTSVILSNVMTGVETPAVTNDLGAYVFVNVNPGRYTLQVEMPGFKTVQIELVLSVNQTITQDLTLAVGEVTETVEVLAETPLLQQSTAELGTVIDEQNVVNLPLNGRNFAQLLTLTPGATPVNTAQGAGGGTGFNAPLTIPGGAFSVPSIQGQVNRANLYLLDGLVNSFFFRGSWAVLPIIDGVQEFKVQSHNDKSEFGGVVGGVVNVVTKSGTNDFHGSGYWFARNDVFDARDPFGDEFSDSPAPFRQNQYGATVGGPIIKNKTHFFFAFEGWRYRRPSQSRFRVPTLEELSGDFSNSIVERDIFDPVTTRPDPNDPTVLIRDPFPNNIIPAGRISTMAQQYIQTYYDSPNLSGDPFFNAIQNRAFTSDAESFQARVDHSFSEEDNVFFRFSSLDIVQSIPSTNKSTTIQPVFPKSAAGGWTHTFGADKILDLRFGFASQPFSNLQESTEGVEPMIQQGFLGIEEFGLLGLNLSSPWGGAGIGASPRPELDRQYHWVGNFSLLRGNHSLRFGASYLYLTRRSRTTGHTFTFTDAPTADPQLIGTTGASLASALLGLPTQGQTRNQNYYHTTPVWSVYFQDDWRVKPNLTLNLGLRFDRYETPHLTEGLNSGFDIDTGNWLIGGTQLPPACDDVGRAPCIPGDGNLANIPFGDFIRLADDPDLGPKVPWDNFGPRFGVAWRLADRTVLRGGYGLVFDTLTALGQTAQQSIGVWPDRQFDQPSWNPVGAELEFLEDIVASRADFLPLAEPWGTTGWFFDPDNKKNPLSHQWHLELQHQLSQNLMVSGAYVGSISRRLELNALSNAAPPGPPGTPEEINSRKPWPWVATMFMSVDRGRASYNSFQFKLNRRLSDGLGYLVSYTWSKVIDEGSSGYYGVENGIGNTGSGLQDFLNPKGSRSVAGYDIPHFLSISSIWEPPLGKGKRFLDSGPGAWILGNWQVNTIIQARTGQPFNLGVVGDVANVGNDIGWWNYARPNLVGDPEISNPTTARFFNTDAFAVPVNSYGNFGRNVLRTENVYNVDLSLFRKFPLWNEDRWLEFRAEFFNIFNIMNYGSPGAVVGQGSFGRISSLITGSRPRQIQFGFRLVF